jgi:MFS family permease
MHRLQAIKGGVASRAAGFADVIPSSPIRRLLLASCVSNAGELAVFVALSVYLFRVSGPALVAALSAIRMLPGMIIVPLVTSWSDRMPRERLLLIIAIPRILLLGSLAAVLVTHGPVALVIAAAALETGLFSTFRPLQAALLPWLARTPAQLTAANAAAGIGDGAAVLGGPALAAVLLAVGTPPDVVIAAASLLVLAGLLLLGVKALAGLVPGQAGRRHIWPDIRAGVSTLVHTPGVRSAVIPAIGQTFARGVLNVFVVVIALDLFHLGQPGVGWLGAAMGLGALVGSPLTFLVVRGRRFARPYGLAIASWGVPFVLLGSLHWKYAPYLLLAALGVANIMGDVAVYTTLQRLIEPGQLGRAMGARELVLLGSVAVGSAIAPWLIDGLGVRHALIAVGLLLFVVPALFARPLIAIDRRLAVPGPEADLLRQLPFMRPLPVGTIEHLANQLTEEIYEPGTLIIREGDAGERFYVIAAGHAQASIGGTALREMGEGDCFGEIALLRRVPRTATVAAIGQLQVWSLTRTEFLAAVTGNPDSVVAAETLAAGRLGARGSSPP